MAHRGGRGNRKLSEDLLAALAQRAGVCFFNRNRFSRNIGARKPRSPLLRLLARVSPDARRPNQRRRNRVILYSYSYVQLRFSRYAFTIKMASRP